MNTKLLPLFAVAALSLGAVSCTNDDATYTAQGTTVISDKLTTFMADAPKTRTSLNYGTEQYFWENGDKIWVKDDNGDWHQSTNAVTGTKVTGFAFTVPGTYTGTSYPVVYHGDTKPDNQVEIATTQTQEKPNDNMHFGTVGDNGVATATKNGNKYDFAIEHKAAYLVFLPYTSDEFLKNSYLTKIEVTADNNIAGTYTLDPTTNQLTGTGTANQIILNTKSSSGTYTNGFPLTNTAASLTTNGAYMVIAPGIHKLKVRYWVKSLTEHDALGNPMEGTITKTYASFNYQANNYYDLKANLKVKKYSGTYYMWDAEKNYWDGHEWDKTNAWQPTVNNTSNSNYPQSDTDPRWFNNFPGTYNSATNTYTSTAAQTAVFKTIPNANEIQWYIRKGEPRWDNDELWTTFGHLYKGGMWFKKKASITDFSSTINPNGDDLRNGIAGGPIYVPSSNVLPNATEQSNFFYLPAMGQYYDDKLESFGTVGYYWTSTSNKNHLGPDRTATSMSFASYGVYFDYQPNRKFGRLAIPFE